MPALANIGVIWAIFIIISIVAQVIKGSKKVSSQAPGGPNTRPGADDEPQRPEAANDELRQFLENLTGGGAAQRPTPPRTPAVERRDPTMKVSQEHRQSAPTLRRAAPPPPPPPPVARPRHAAPQPPRPERPAPPPVPVITLPPAPACEHEVELETFTHHDSATCRLQRMIQEELLQTDAKRKAIVLREILGPPLSLRREAQRA